MIPPGAQANGGFFVIQYFRYGWLFRGVVLSLLLHGLALLFFSKILTPPATISRSLGSSKIELLLLSAEQVQAPIADPLVGLSVAETEPGFLEPISSLGQKNEGGSSRRAGRPSFQPYEQNGLRVAEQTVVEEVTVSAVAPAEPLLASQDGLREYRINLGREASRFKRYPLSARERGWEGVVVVVVSTMAGVAVPQVRLSRSSGYAQLDTQALETMGLAVEVANLPESLRGRDFALDLLIRFSLDD